MTDQKQFPLSAPEQCELERQADTIKREQTEGRYTLMRAAQILHSAKGERAILDAVINVPTPQQVMLPYSGTSERRILEALAKAVISKELKSYWPGDELIQECEPSYGVICNVLEVYADDLNRWIENNQPRINHRFNIVDAPAAKVGAVPAATPKAATNKKAWDDARLRALWEESIMPGVTNTSLANKHGVTRQRIGALLKDAKNKFSTMKSSPQNKNSWGQLINK